MDLSDDAGQITASQPFLKREQRVLRALGFDMDQPVAQIFGQSMQVRPPAQLDRARILHPQDVAPIIPFSERIFRRGGHFQRVLRQCQSQTRPACVAPACKDFAVKRLIGKTGPPVRLTRFGNVRNLVS